jgi:hypothetical protein
MNTPTISNGAVQIFAETSCSSPTIDDIYEDSIERLDSMVFKRVYGLKGRYDILRDPLTQEVEWWRAFENEQVCIDRIIDDNRELVFQSPLLLDESYKENTWFYESERLNIFGHGPSKKAALDGFKAAFLDAYELYTDEDDGNLTADARDFKTTLINLIEEAKEI